MQTRTQQAERLRADAGRLEDLQDRNVTACGELAGQQAAIDLDARLTAFGGTAAEAQGHLLALAEQASWGEPEWTAACGVELDRVLAMCFPPGAPAEQIPREIAGLRADVRWARAAGGDTFPALHRALRTYLAQTEQEDEYQRQRIIRQRADRSADLAAAGKGLAEAAQAAAAHRASVAAGIKAKLKKVAAQFDRLDQEYGGYGAALDFPEPEPPAEPDKPWRWTVTPKWRRAEGQRMSPYNLRGNTAQMDEKAVKLVCAAALAGGTDRPLLLLVLDELGRNLGKQHRTEAVALFERIGRDRNITVIGALQDDMERYAIDASGLYVKLRRSDASPYNSAPATTATRPGWRCCTTGWPAIIRPPRTKNWRKPPGKRRPLGWARLAGAVLVALSGDSGVVRRTDRQRRQRVQRVQAEPARVAQDGAFLLLGLPGGLLGQLGRQRAQLTHPGPVDQDVARRQYGDPFQLPLGGPAGQAGGRQHGADLRHVERVGRVPGQLVALLDDPVVELHHLALERQAAHVVGGEPEPLAHGEAAVIGSQRGRPQRLRHHRVPLVLGGDQLAEQPLAAFHHELQVLDGRDLVREQLRRRQIQRHRQCLPRLC